MCATFMAQWNHNCVSSATNGQVRMIDCAMLSAQCSLETRSHNEKCLHQKNLFLHHIYDDVWLRKLHKNRAQMDCNFIISDAKMFRICDDATVQFSSFIFSFFSSSSPLLSLVHHSEWDVYKSCHFHLVGFQTHLMRSNWASKSFLLPTHSTASCLLTRTDTHTSWVGRCFVELHPSPLYSNWAQLFSALKT